MNLAMCPWCFRFVLIQRDPQPKREILPSISGDSGCLPALGFSAVNGGMDVGKSPSSFVEPFDMDDVALM
jgi:hypothetical protein